MLKHFKMYRKITDIGEKSIGLNYLIWGKVVVVISTFSDNIQYDIEKPVKVRLIMNEEMQLRKGKLLSRELGAFIARKLMTTKDGIIKTNKLAHITDMVISLDELDNTEHLENGRFNNILLILKSLQTLNQSHPVTRKSKQ